MAEIEEARVTTLERELEKLKKKPKDGWDKAQIVGGMLIPLSIGLAGFWYNQASQRTAADETHRAEAQQKEYAQTQARISQAQLISTFMDALSSGSRQKRLLAIEAVQYALPEESVRLLQIVSMDSAEPAVQRAAQTVLSNRLSQLIADCFSNSSEKGKRAASELIRSWSTDDKLVDDLITTASTQSWNSTGVINALTVLESVNPTLFATHETRVLGFLKTVQSNSPDTATHAANVEARLRSLLRDQITGLVAQIRERGEKDVIRIQMQDTALKQPEIDYLVKQLGKTPSEAAIIANGSPTGRASVAKSIEVARAGGFIPFQPQIKSITAYLDASKLDKNSDYPAARKEVEQDCLGNTQNPQFMPSCSIALEKLALTLQ